MPATTSPPAIATTGIELFRAGTHRDSQGNQRTWTLSQLDEIATSYNSIAGKVHDAPAIPAAPIQTGHDGQMAYGWLSQAYRQGDKLLGDYRDVDPAFAEQVNAGRYRKRSISLYPPDHQDNPTPGKWNIRHVAYVSVPAIKGMKDHCFNDSGEGFVEFTEDGEAAEFEAAQNILSTLLQKQRDRLIADTGIEEADKVFPPELLDRLQSASRQEYVAADEFKHLGEEMNEIRRSLFEFKQNVMAQLEQMQAALVPLQQSFAETDALQSSDIDEPIDSSRTDFEAQLDTTKTPIEEPMTESNLAPIPSDLEARFSELQAQFAELQTQFTEQQTQLQSAQADLTDKQSEIDGLKAINAAQAFNTERDRITNFVERMISQEHRLRPEDRSATLQLLLASPADHSVEFGEGEEKTTKSLRQALMDEISNRPVLWSNSRMPTNPSNAPDGIEGGFEFSAPEGVSIDPESAKQHQKAVQYCQKKGWNWKDADKYQSALIATAV